MWPLGSTRREERRKRGASTFDKSSEKKRALRRGVKYGTAHDLGETGGYGRRMMRVLIDIMNVRELESQSKE